MSRRLLRSARPPQEQLEAVVTLPVALHGEIGRRKNQSKRVKLEHEDGMFLRVRYERESESFDVAQLRDEVNQFLHPIVDGTFCKPALVFSACCGDAVAESIIVAKLQQVAATQDWRELWVCTGQIREWLHSGVARNGAERPWWVREARARRPPDEVAEVVEMADDEAIDVTNGEATSPVKLDSDSEKATAAAAFVEEEEAADSDDEGGGVPVMDVLKEEGVWKSIGTLDIKDSTGWEHYSAMTLTVSKLADGTLQGTFRHDGKDDYVHCTGKCRFVAYESQRCSIKLEGRALGWIHPSGKITYGMPTWSGNRDDPPDEIEDFMDDAPCPPGHHTELCAVSVRQDYEYPEDSGRTYCQGDIAVLVADDNGVWGNGGCFDGNYDFVRYCFFRRAADYQDLPEQTEVQEVENARPRTRSSG
jgi:hypothetical protein